MRHRKARVARVAVRLGLGLALAVASGQVARAQAIGQGFELERAGQFEQAASIYFATLRADPTNLSALLGLERVLPASSNRRYRRCWRSMVCWSRRPASSWRASPSLLLLFLKDDRSQCNDP